MGVFLNVNWRYVNAVGQDTIGWTAPTEDQPLYPLERIAASAAEYRAAGFTAVLLPPFTKGASGGYSGGYDLFDPYDLGSKNQCGSVPTAFGTLDMLRQCIAVIHRYQMQAYGDLVLHQYDGGQGNTYTYVGSKAPGRFPKHPSCFVVSSTNPGGVQPDPVPDETGNFAFGSMASYVNATPPGYMHDGAIANAGWQTETTGVDGWRIDDAKGTNGSFVYNLLTSKPLAGTWCFGEYYDGNPSAVWNWVHGYQQGRAGALDFAFKYNMQNICNNNSRVWMGQLADIGYCCIDAANAVTFVESADTATSYGQQTVWNKALGYAVMLTFPGYPCVYYQDWSTDPGCFGLKPIINNLIWIHEHLAQGTMVVRLDTDFQVFVHERLGYGQAPGCVCFFNNDQWSSYTRTVQTHFGPYARMHEYTGNGSVDDVWTDQDGRLTVTIPRNNNGHGYVIYGPAGVTGDFESTPVETTQIFFGADDLDIPPMTNDVVTIGPVWCAEGSYLSATLQADRTDWGNDASVLIVLLDNTDTPLGSLSFDDQNLDEQGFTETVKTAGWHRVQLTSTGLPDTGSAFCLRVNYTAAPI